MGTTPYNELVNEKVCAPVAKKVCTLEPVEKCDDLKEPVTSTVPTKHCYKQPRKVCKQVPETVCYKVAMKECNKVPRQECINVPKTECSTDVKKECSTEYEKVTKNESKEVCKKVPVTSTEYKNETEGKTVQERQCK